MPKATKPRREGDVEETARRVGAVVQLILDGAQVHDLLQFAAEQTPPWGVKERQIRNYMESARKLIAARYRPRRRQVVAVHVARREALIARCVNAADYGTAARLLADLAKLQGAYPEQDAGAKAAPAGPIEVVIRETVVDARAPEQPPAVEAPDPGAGG